MYLKLSPYNLTKPLADTFGATSQVLFSDYLTPDQIVATPLEDLAAVIARESRGRPPVADPNNFAYYLELVNCGIMVEPIGSR